MRYVRPKSLSWWAGVLMIAMGVAQAAGLPSGGAGGALGAVMGVLNALAGAAAMIGGVPASPASLIFMGLGVIGLRDAIQRERDHVDSLHDETMMNLAFIEARQGGEMATEADMFGDDEGDADLDFSEPDGESPLPPGVRDPWGDGGSRG